MAEEKGAAPALVVDSVSKSFGAVQAVQEVGFTVERGSLTCLIGPNGAGKSTLLHCVSGFLRSDRGQIQLEGRNVARWPSGRRS
jgi:ABC-type branched-subunit amino acid transport system ATPase component